MPGTEFAYSGEDLAYYAHEFADDEWMVHVVGPDDCYLRTNPDLADDAPNTPLVPAATARALVAATEKCNAWHDAKYPLEEPAGLVATIFRRGVPWTPEPITEEN